MDPIGPWLPYSLRLPLDLCDWVAPPVVRLLQERALVQCAQLVGLLAQLLLFHLPIDFHHRLLFARQHRNRSTKAAGRT